MSCSGTGQRDNDSGSENGEGGGWLTIIDSGISPSVPVVAYRVCDGDRLDGWRFCSMCLHGELLEMRDRNDIRSDTAAGAWIRHWKHWGHQGAT